MGSTWLCLDCGWVFSWIRRGVETRPDSCPNCGSVNVDAIEA